LFDVEARSLLNDFRENLQMKSLENLRLLNVYDIFGTSEENLVKAKKTIFAEMPTDNIYDNVELDGKKYFAVEYLPGQFDQRADSAMQCMQLISDSAEDTVVKSGKLLILEGNISDEDIQEIKKYYINPVESREKDIFAPLQIEALPKVEDVVAFEGFINYNAEELAKFRAEQGLAMSDRDIAFVQEYFKNTEKRDPMETEIKVLDTYWSDHCRHTTFETELTNIVIPSGKLHETIQKTYEDYLTDRTNVHGNRKPMCLMDMATITMKKT
jgi:phosphoribosylformylglycinamidine synthase